MEEPPNGRRSLASAAALMSIATTASRITGFLRVLAVAAAMGTTFLANTYQTANTAPNLMFELVAAGVLTSVFVPTFVGFLVRGDKEGGWETANVLTSVALVALIGLSIVLALAAPLVMRLLTIGVESPGLRAREIELGSTWLRLFAPQIALYGAGMIMTGALHAYRRFTLPAIAPIFNNIIVTAVYLAYAAMRSGRPANIRGITTAETLLLGLGTTAGVVAMTVCLIPPLRRLGWRFRFRFRPKDPAVKRAARLGTWALGYAGGYQAGLIVVLLLANRVEGGVAAYQWAFTFFFVPHAIFAVPIFNALFPAMSEHAVGGDMEGLLKRLREGMAMLAFALVPIACFLAVTSDALARITLEYGVMSSEGAALVGRVIGAFAVGLPMYSAFLVTTRAFYATGDTKTPALFNAGAVAVASIAGSVFFFVLPDDWSVAGLALGHSLGFAAGTLALSRAARTRLGAIGSSGLTGSWVRAAAAGLLALGAMALVDLLLAEGSRSGALLSVVAAATVGAAVYVAAMAWMRSPEWLRVRGLIARRTA